MNAMEICEAILYIRPLMNLTCQEIPHLLQKLKVLVKTSD
jgi:hypothetical protein